MWCAAALAAVVVSVAAFGQTTVKSDQGKPGTQGPWPVTLVNTAADAGGSFVIDAPCGQLVDTNDAGVGTTASRVPVSGPQASRIWIRVCNDLVNSASTQCRCSVSTCPAATTAGNPGDLLAQGDCVTYNIGARDAGIPCCVCNGAGSWLPTQECVP
jgi:hypothetical protein